MTLPLLQISTALLGCLLGSPVAADYHYPHFATFGLDDALHEPWLVNDYTAYRPEASRPAAYHFDNLDHGGGPTPAPKREAQEKKDSNKSASEVGSLAGTAHCQEISASESATGAAERKGLSCYRCKDPLNGSSYERCSNAPKARLGPRGSRQPDNLGAAATNDKSKRARTARLPEPYHFSDDYFHPEGSQERSADKCEKVVRDSMVCMVCKDPRSNGNYEQCSYVAQPKGKAYAYSKSSSFGEPKTREQIVKEAREAGRKTKKPRADKPEKPDKPEKREKPEHLHYRHEPEEAEEGSAEDREAHDTRYVPDYNYRASSYFGSEEESAAPSSDCKTVSRDGQSCSVCTNPKTGGQSEKCSYAHEPKDKAYEYSKSKSFGYPSHSAEDDRSTSESSKEKPSGRQEAGSAEDYSASGGYSDEPYEHSESERVSEKVKGEGDCRKVRRDGMVCTVCKDERTGGDYEQCNYSYDPEDKVYAYTKSRSFGGPGKSPYGEDDYSAGASSEEQPEESFSAPVIYPTSTSTLDYVPKGSESRLSSVLTTKRPQDKKPDSRVDSGFYDAKVRRDEIEKIVKDIETVDKSKCKKTKRSGMTCYRCADGKGATNEECVYVAEPEKAETSGATETLLVTAKPTERLWDSLASTSSLEPAKRKTRAAPKDKDEEMKVLSVEIDEAEPYEFVQETRPVYDKVLGMTLPAYMLEKSPHEIEFDEAVEKF